MQRIQKNHFHRLHQGSTLLDTTLALFVLGFMVILIGTFVSSRETNRHTLFRSQAAALADEQMNALRRLDVTTLANQTNGSFKQVLYNAGTWRVVAQGSAGHSAPNALELSGSGLTTTSGRLIFPAGAYGDATIESAFRLANDSPAAAAFGFLFRATDNANGYRLRFARTAVDLDISTGGTQNMILEKIVAGVATRIDSRAVTIAVDTWYTIRIITAGSNLSVYLNGSQLGSGPFVDTTYTSGATSLLGWGGAHLFVDDIETTTTTTATWDFDSDTELPAAWVRLGLNDLPDDTTNALDDNGTLTIATYPAGSSTTTLKQATITVEWLTRGSLQSYTTTGLLGRSGVGL